MTPRTAPQATGEGRYERPLSREPRKEKAMKWMKIKAGEYRSHPEGYSVSKTYSRSGWVCWDHRDGWYTYESSLEKGKEVLEGRNNTKLAEAEKGKDGIE